MLTILYETKLSVCNTLTVGVEMDFNDQYSIVAHDELGDFFIERFTSHLEEVQRIADKLHGDIVKNYNK